MTQCGVCEMNSIQKGMIEKILKELPDTLHSAMEEEGEFMINLIESAKNADELIDKLIYELATARANLQKQRYFMRSMGTVYSAKCVDFPEKFATARDFINDITLDMIWLERTHNMAVLCAASNKYFVMDWESIARIAVRNGVAVVDTPDKSEV